ncbi:MAG: hypothetical protein ACTHNW_12910 [Mucilaginibacter sp.]
MKTLNIKSFILVALIGVLSYSADAQKKVKQVPQAVSAAFANQYAQAHLKNWYVDNGQYIACFRYNDRDWMAHYSADGNWLRSERNIKHIATLPYDVRTALKNSKYASYHVDEMARLQMPDHSSMYRLRVDNNSGNKVAFENAGAVDNESLYFSDNGRLVRTANSGDE